MLRSNKIIALVVCMMIITVTACTKTDDSQSDEADKDNLVLKMEMDENYSDSDPFENGLLFCVSQDIPTLDAEVYYRMNGERGTVEIKDKDSDEILWSHTWKERVNVNVLTISLRDLQKDKEYVVHFTGNNIKQATVKVTFDSDLVQGKARSSKKTS